MGTILNQTLVLANMSIILKISKMSARMLDSLILQTKKIWKSISLLATATMFRTQAKMFKWLTTKWV